MPFGWDSFLLWTFFMFKLPFSLLGLCFASLLAASRLVDQQDPILVLTDAYSERGISTDFPSWGTSGTLCTCGQVCCVLCP